jgi:amino acid transporter
LFCVAILLIFLLASSADSSDSSSSQNQDSNNSINQLFIFTPLFDHYLSLQSSSYVYLLFLFPLIGSLIGFLYSAFKILRAMTESKLFLIGSELAFSIFNQSNLELFVTILVPLIALLVYSSFIIEDLFWIIYSFSIYSFLISSISNFLSFIVFRRKYETLHREFHSPFGIIGAIYGIFVFLVVFVAMLLRDQDRLVVLVSYGFFLISFFLIFQRVKRRQIFSKEEETILFLAHVMKGKIICNSIPVFRFICILFFLFLTSFSLLSD